MKELPGSHEWTVEEFSEMTKFLQLSNYLNWEPCEVCLIVEILNRNFCSAEVLARSEFNLIIEKIREYQEKHLTALPRFKSETISADSLDPLTTNLFKKSVDKWGDKEGELLLFYLGNVTIIDAKQSTAEALDRYVKLIGLLTSLYIGRPDIKVKIDPEVVFFDISLVDVKRFAIIFAEYQLPAHFGPMPLKQNPGALPLMFPMPSQSFNWMDDWKS